MTCLCVHAKQDRPLATIATLFAEPVKVKQSKPHEIAHARVSGLDRPLHPNLGASNVAERYRLTGLWEPTPIGTRRGGPVAIRPDTAHETGEQLLSARPPDRSSTPAGVRLDDKSWYPPSVHGVPRHVHPLVQHSHDFDGGPVLPVIDHMGRDPQPPVARANFIGRAPDPLTARQRFTGDNDRGDVGIGLIEIPLVNAVVPDVRQVLTRTRTIGHRAQVRARSRISDRNWFRSIGTAGPLSSP